MIFLFPILLRGMLAGASVMIFYDFFTSRIGSKYLSFV